MHIISVPKRLETPMDKSKWTAITDPAEATELLERRAELDTPTLYAPNGLLWVVAEEYRLWRAEREKRVTD